MLCAARITGLAENAGSRPGSGFDYDPAAAGGPPKSRCMSLQNRREGRPIGRLADRCVAVTVRPSGSDVEAHVQDVAVLDDVVTALHAHPAAALGLGLAARL